MTQLDSIAGPSEIDASVEPARKGLFLVSKSTARLHTAAFQRASARRPRSLGLLALAAAALAAPLLWFLHELVVSVR